MQEEPERTGAADLPGKQETGLWHVSDRFRGDDSKSQVMTSRQVRRRAGGYWLVSGLCLKYEA